MTQNENLYWDCYDTRILGFNNEFISLPQGTSFIIYQGDTVMADLLITKDPNSVPCVYETITGKFYYWENNNG